MLHVFRIFAAAVVLTAWGQAAPALSAHIVPIEQPGRTADAAPAPGATCPLRAWPYIG